MCVCSLQFFFLEFESSLSEHVFSFFGFTLDSISNSISNLLFFLIGQSQRKIVVTLLSLNKSCLFLFGQFFDQRELFCFLVWSVKC